MSRTMAWARWIGDDRGQDLIEYALLTSFLGIAGLLGMQVLGITMHDVYESWDQPTQDAWEVPDPISGS